MSIKKFLTIHQNNQELIDAYDKCQNQNLLLDILQIIDELKLDEASIVAEILNFCFDEKFNETTFVEANYDEDILSLFSSLRELRKYSAQSLAEAENFRMMLFAISKDIRVIMIKLCILLAELRNMTSMTTESEKLKLMEVRDIYAPLAERLGLNFIKSELEDICLKFLEPKIYNYLLTNIASKKEENDKQIEITLNKLQTITNDLKIESQISYRQKHFSSINKKMKNNNVSLAKIYDLIAMRVVVSSVEECYAVLGGIHSVYRPMPNRFKDYISNPKPNGYQSIHTTIIAENNRPLEIQIRTQEMHKISEYGIAAHWIYKEKRIKKSELDEKLSFIRSIMENSESLSSIELIDIFKTQLNSGTIYVQTPKGKIIDFPETSTLVDFAYSIHSEIGNTCVGGKINGKIKPLNTQMQNGDVVEILTNQNSKGPSRDWLNFVVTASARSKIKAYFKKEYKNEHIKAGKRIVEEELKLRNIPLSCLTDKEFVDMYSKLCFNSETELFASVGYGSTSVRQVVNRLQNELSSNKVVEVIKPRLVLTKNKDGILIDGDSGMLVRYANCCTPVAGDEIIGYISRGKGVTVHRKSCHNVKFLEDERLIQAEWNEKSSQQFKANLIITSEPSESLVQNLLKQIMENKIYILSFKSKLNKQNQLVTWLNIQVSSNADISKTVNIIKNNNRVIEVVRNND